MTLIKNGNETTCIPNNPDKLVEAEKQACANALISRMQREHPDTLMEIIQQEKERQEIEELDKLKQIPTLHMASTVHDQVNNTGAKKLSPLELRRITSRIANSPEYHAAFTNYHMKKQQQGRNSGGNNMDAAKAAVPELYNATAASSSSDVVPVEKKAPCAKTVKSLYKLQERIVSGGAVSP